ncbi:MAG: oxidoreductase [Chloroflexi bacterium]|nr:MAG: oxidoreductase [Chloroflexota bacterium]
MARAAVQRRLTWRLAEVAAVIAETPRVRSLVLAVPDWPGHLAGQHVDVRLTAEDGYQAQRSYSISSAPDDEGRLTLTVERLEDGEVSPYLTDELRAGDELELRGPIGGYFVWQASGTDPILLVGGGSGVCPLMAMLRHRAARSSTVPARLLYSARDLGDVIYRPELDRLAAAGDGAEVTLTLTRARPPGWTGYGRRVDAEMLAEVAWPPERRPLTFVCGPTPFVELVAGSLVALGHDPGRIKTERFGPTGG